ncbi:lysylphosphatidylglycerol synthase domain-containing protein [Apilactobacillus apisilvae]|uniref:Phosphatidylglycerol lysyltransferase n=1 Tax=Apilactobacillus apisilvae TaxID=2923364 RepID=A0ABY4PGN6_9LACO|nr:lysylphosphatidylglycerol synthase domain-containing protein [Apilactobacillus apisilvae]UQS84818.1 lysylphosphatidylglycerol synthase domain-containing protein [Apilactobacillus apisilvae]
MNISKKANDFFNKHSRAIKSIYVTVIVILILVAFNSIRKEVHWHQVMQSFSNLTPTKIIMLIVLGLISIIPMAIYDYEYVKQSHKHFKTSTILVNSYVINTVTNLAGGGGIIGGSLRTYLFGKVKDVKQTVVQVSQIALFTLTGLSINAIIVIGLHFFFDIKLNLFYWLVLIGFIIYLVTLVFFRAKSLSTHDTILLLTGSLFEWICCLSFFVSIGLFLGYNFSIPSIYSLVAVAGMIGIISFIPGGLGSFDSIMIAGMSANGLNVNQALTWLIIYRVTYYILPFLVGITLYFSKIIHNKYINNK